MIEIDAASESGVEKVRETIVEQADYQPGEARFRIYIIDEVHDLSGKAFDALLKTIEEPPAHLIFILATTEFNKVPRTIQSRCQKFDFHRGSLSDLVARLEHVAKAEQIPYEPAALGTIARMADGGYRDALTLLEQAAITADGPITTQHVYAQFGWVDDAVSDALLLSICDKDVPKLLETLEQVFGSGRDPKAVVESLIYRLSELTGAIYGVAGTPGEDSTLQAALHETAVRIGQERLLKLRGELAEAHKTLRDISLPRLWLESELLKLASETKPAAKAEARAIPTKAVTSTEPTSPARGKPQTVSPAIKAGKEEPVAPAHPEPKPSGDPELDRAQQVWHAVVTDLGERSKMMAMKLASTVVSKFENGRLEIRFDREIERDAVLEGQKGDQRRQAILETVRAKAREDWEVEYSVGPRANGEAAAPAVELPVEGERLVEMAKEILGGA